MWRILVAVLFATAAAQDYHPLCQNRTYILGERVTSISLPKESYYLTKPCYFTFHYPKDTVFYSSFEGFDYEYAKYGSALNRTIIDAFGTVYNVSDFAGKEAALPPPFCNFVLSTNTSIYVKEVASYVNWVHRPIKLNYASNVREYHIGSEPRVFVVNESMQEQTAYKIKSNSKVAAYFVGRDYPAGQKRIADGSSVFLLSGTGNNSHIIGTANQLNEVQYFKELNFVRISPHTDRGINEMIVLMDAADLTGLHKPQFIKLTYRNVSVSGKKETSVTVLDAENYYGRCNYYEVNFIQFSDDLEIVVHTGFPKKKINENTIIVRLKGSQLKSNYTTLIIGCTNTFRILRGSVVFSLSYYNFWYYPYLDPSKLQRKIIVKTERSIQNVLPLQGYMDKAKISSKFISNVGKGH